MEEGPVERRTRTKSEPLYVISTPRISRRLETRIKGKKDERSDRDKKGLYLSYYPLLSTPSFKNELTIPTGTVTTGGFHEKEERRREKETDREIGRKRKRKCSRERPQKSLEVMIPREGTISEQYFVQWRR